MSKYGLRSLQEEFQKLGFVGEQDKKSPSTSPVGQVEDTWTEQLEEDDDSEDDDSEDDAIDEATRKIVTATGQVQKVQVARGAEKMKRKKQTRKGKSKAKRRARSGAAKRKKKILKRKSGRGNVVAKKARVHGASADFGQPTSPMTEPQGTDRLDTLLSQLESMTNESEDPTVGKKLDENTARLVRIYGNVAAIADDLSGRIEEGDELHESFDKLATDALEIAEALCAGKVDFETAKAEVKNYVKDLVEHMQTIEEDFEGGLEEMQACDDDEDEDEDEESEDDKEDEEEEEDE